MKQPSNDELFAHFQSLPTSEKVKLRTHARHERERPNSAQAYATCTEPRCRELRDEGRLLERLRERIAGPRHLAGALRITEWAARAILLDGPRDDGERQAIVALLDGSP